MIKVLRNKIKLFYFLLFFVPVTLFAVPLAPSTLQLQALSQTSVSLQWTDNSQYESGFKIFRNGELIHTTVANITAYTDEKLLAHTEYTYTVKATDSLAHIETTKDTYGVLEPVNVSLSGMSGDAEDWVAIFPLGATTHWDNVVTWAFTNGIVNGTVSIDGVPAGEYDVRAFFNNTFTVETIDTFTVSGTTVSTDKTVYTEGETITVSLAGMSGDVKDWVGIYPVGSNNDWGNVRAWKYTNGILNGDLILDAVAAGEYEARVFFRNSFQLEAKTTFRVSAQNTPAEIFIIGDSTVQNDSAGEQGWGSRLADYTLAGATTVTNQARSGASSKSYLNNSGSHHDWTSTKDLMLQADKSNGAYLFIQFGHNDEKADDVLHTDTGRGNSYYNYLKSYVDEARAMGVIPVLITPVERQYVNHRDHGLYPQTMRELAKDENVILLDLEEKSFIEFAQYASNEDLWAVYDHDDHTHFNPNGASIVAGWVKDLACSADATLCGKFQ